MSGRRCITQTCLNKGRAINQGWCDACSYDLVSSFDHNRRDAERLAASTGKPWLVAELHPSASHAVRAAKLGRKAYGAYPARDRAALEKSGYKVCEVYSFDATTGEPHHEQTEYAP